MSIVILITAAGNFCGNLRLTSVHSYARLVNGLFMSNLQECSTSYALQFHYTFNQAVSLTLHGMHTLSPHVNWTTMLSMGSFEPIQWPTSSTSLYFRHVHAAHILGPYFFPLLIQ